MTTQESQNHLGWRGSVEIIQSTFPRPLLKLSHLEQVVQDHVQMAVEGVHLKTFFFLVSLGFVLRHVPWLFFFLPLFSE